MRLSLLCSPVLAIVGQHGGGGGVDCLLQYMGGIPFNEIILQKVGDLIHTA